MEEKDFSIENRLRDQRKQKKLSQEELAEALGISRQSIIALETGKTLPSLPLAVSICRFFNSAFEEMFEFEREISEEIEKTFSDANNINIISDSDDESELRRKETKMELQPWRPFREAMNLHDAVDRLFDDNYVSPLRSLGGMPKINIKDKGDKVLIEAELPGVAEEDINVEILDDIMTISGEKKEEKEESGKDKGYYYKESHSGAFSRSFTLPADVVADQAEADMKNGVLKVTVPKIEPKKAKKISIKNNV